MNLALFDAEELTTTLPETDTRVRHVREILRLPLGTEFNAGVIDGDRGRACFVQSEPGRLRVQFRATDPGSTLFDVDVIVGLSRPQTCRSVLRALTSMGVRSIEFVQTDLGQLSYATSKLWITDEWRTRIIEAASQAFVTALPTVRVGRSLHDALTHAVPYRVALDNYEPTSPLKAAVSTTRPLALVIGSERGWTDRERGVLRDHNCLLASLGPRVLRVEVAATSAVAVALSERAWTEAVATPIGG